MPKWGIFQITTQCRGNKIQGLPKNNAMYVDADIISIFSRAKLFTAASTIKYLQDKPLVMKQTPFKKKETRM